MPSLDNLKKEAKRWLKALQTRDPAARDRFQHAHPTGPASPVLRDVQHALAREHGFESWARLKAALASAAPAARDDLATRFLEFACPDHHVRTRPAHDMAAAAAMRLLNRHPDLARADLYTAVVCGELEIVDRILRDRPQLADARRPSSGPDRSGAGGQYDFLHELGGKDWTPLLFLTHTRLPLAKANANSVEIARLLLDRGADPNAFFVAGASRYTPLSGAIGEGEENRPPHPRRDELVRLLLARGAEPYDSQVIYNIHFHGRVLWYLELMHEFSVRAGRAADWADPEWRMLTQGPHGSGARWHFRIAVEQNDLALAEWCLAHGARPDSAIYEQAIRRGDVELAELLARHGAPPVEVVLSPEDAFLTAALRLDRDELARRPEFLRSHKALFEAARRNRADAVALLLDLGTPVDIQDEQEQRALHVAAYNNSLRVAHLLIDRGAEIDRPERHYGGTPLDFAVHAGNREMIELLAPHSRDVGNLARFGYIDRLREVLAAEPQLAQETWDTTPLFWLPDDPQLAVETARLLLAHGADPAFRQPKDGATAADIARRRGLDEAADLLDGLGLHRAHTPEQWQSLAEDYVRAYEHDAAALDRLNAHYDRAFTRDDLLAEIWRRNYAYRQRSGRVDQNFLKVDEAQLILAQNAGFSSWDALLDAARSGAPPAVPAFTISGDRIEPLRRLTGREWDELIAAARDHRATALDAHGLMTDRALAAIATLDRVTSLDLSGSRELTDDGLLHLARMPQLERLTLSGAKLTDRGLEVLRHLPNLCEFEMTWQAGITDAGVANLRFCDRLERVDLMGSPTGDAAVEAIAGKPHLRAVSTGRLVTDAGLAALCVYRGEKLLLDGPFTDDGLAQLASLQNLVELDLFWHCAGITSAAFSHLAKLPNLQSLACDGKLGDDAAMAHIGAMPSLRFLRARECAATDDGFVALARSRSLEGYWGRDSAGFGTRAFLAFSKIPTLHRLGVTLAHVDAGALARLAEFPDLRELTPIGLRDDAFRHIGNCPKLERLTCMYCRETGDAATEHLANLSLKYYYAGLTQITDRSLEILGRMPSLEQIDLYECKGITDAGVAHLAALPRLREVHLDGLPGVTFEGTKVFRKEVTVGYSS